MVLELFEPAFEFTLGMARKPIFIAFVSDGCGYCAQMKPGLEAVAKQFKGRVDTWQVNVDRSQGLGETFAADGVPVLMGFHNSTPVFRQVGAPDQQTLAAMFDHLAKVAA